MASFPIQGMFSKYFVLVKMDGMYSTIHIQNFNQEEMEVRKINVGRHYSVFIP